jgi:hypothetical protein
MLYNLAYYRIYIEQAVVVLVEKRMRRRGRY